ncbi:DUF3107 domain-containing protein [Citricoccus nitrophenolicus]|uniref:DUF3107 domain-containing protein n=1 Tax=Citricoccus nitrophenolicus TaxID=863575 RepID=A0ABV0IIK9_9MICC|nr:DUF3107 domain-containing protein [Citricoccus sp. I39-566]NUL46747.1 DUF3107 domain-containing protein [Cellulosimicrobium funkei]WMY77778.1 DUF3107 domain-containing protein [Citricoccus sp. I39-566]
MEIRIGVQNVAREVVIESDASNEDVARLVTDALADGGPLRLKDTKGRLVLVPSTIIGYVEIGTETPRPVGFVPTPGS